MLRAHLNNVALGVNDMGHAEEERLLSSKGICRPSRGARRWCRYASKKRCFESIFAPARSECSTLIVILILLPIVAPLGLIVALAIVVVLGRPILFFLQQRPGS